MSRDFFAYGRLKQRALQLALPGSLFAGEHHRSVVMASGEKIIASSTTVESKSKADCISMKTTKNCYDAGFQVCFAAASQDAGIHGSRRIDACAGNWR